MSKKKKRTTAADVYQQMGKVGNTRGEISETMVESLLPKIGSDGFPGWVYAGRKTGDGQKRGFLFSTDVGDFLILVKGSAKSAKKVRASRAFARKEFAVLVVRRTNSQEGVLRGLVYKLTDLREHRLKTGRGLPIAGPSKDEALDGARFEVVPTCSTCRNWCSTDLRPGWGLCCAISFEREDSPGAPQRPRTPASGQCDFFESDPRRLLKRVDDYSDFYIEWDSQTKDLG